MQRAAPLIQTKLHLPFTRPGLVPRPRLQEQIARGLRGPLTLVVAPAGFGKTTLVACCVANREMGVAWLSLDKNDNPSGRFLTYLVAALRTAGSRIGSEAAQLLADIQQTSPEAVLTSLINDLDSAGGEVVLVLDDYQLITNQSIHENVTFLLDHCPNTFHLVVATRSDPSLPLARLRARGQLVELRAADLRFTISEASRFLNDVMGLNLGAESVALLEERTEGWVAGLQMAALSMRDRADVHGFIEGFSGTNRYILDYLLEEVLASQPPDITHFLLFTSILERLTAPLCDYLLESNLGPQPGGGIDASNPALSSHQVLEYLERQNLFLISLDEERVWFRYHHLFADLLQARLQQAQPDVIPVLRARASAWLEQEGWISEAIQHLLAARELDRAADLIERYGPGRWEESDISVVQMAENLPPKMLLERPKIGIYQAWLLINQGIIEKALPLLEDLARHFASTQTNSKQKWMDTWVRLALAFLGRQASALGGSPLPGAQELQAIPANELVLRDAADILLGMALTRRGEIDRAAEFSVQAIQKQKMRHGTLAIPSLVPFLATLFLFQGRLREAASLCREYLELIKEKGIKVSTAGNLDVVLGNVHYEWNALELAEKHIRAGLRANEPWQNIMTDAFGLLALAHTLKARGDYAGAMQTVEKFEWRLRDQTRPIEFYEEYRTLRVLVELAFGNLQTALDWADRLPYSEDFHLHPIYYQRTLARTYLAQGRYAEVEKMLEIYMERAPSSTAGNWVAQQLEINLLRAAAASGQQRLPDALALVKASLFLAEPEGYIRAFLDLGQPVRDLLAAYLRTEYPVHKTFARKVLDAFTPSNTSGSQPAGLVEPLSDRELEVLQLMALGKTNQEIARQLVVARGTIKAHAASIYRKLEVANRTEAVARARQLGILS